MNIEQRNYYLVKATLGIVLIILEYILRSTDDAEFFKRAKTASLAAEEVMRDA